ncbi:hypothetical protein Tco_0311771 [Tanacetum coccineum]
MTSPSSSIPPSTLIGAGCFFEVIASLLVELYLLLKEESDILWKLTLLFFDLRVMVPVSNLIMALLVVKNGVPKMKGLFSFYLTSKITKSTRNICSATSTNTSSAIPKGLMYEWLASGSLMSVSAGLSSAENRVLQLLLRSQMFRLICFRPHFQLHSFSRPPLLAFLFLFRDFAGREFLEKPEHFSHPTIDLLTLLENGVLKSFHPFEGEVLNNFPRFVSILVAEFAAGGAVNLAFKMKGDMIIENLDLKPMIDAMMRDFLE